MLIIQNSILPKLVIVTSLFFSLNGHLLANENDDEKAIPKQVRLMLIDADGSNVRELFRSEIFTFLGSPTYSADGEKIAMDGWETQKGQSFGNSHILTINSDGTILKDIGDGAMPSWSPDGKQITFSRYRPRGVWIMDADGANCKCIDPAGWGAQWSPDGSKIVYSSYDLGEANLKIYHTKEDTFSYVFPFKKSPYKSYHFNSCWSPDSKSVCVKVKSKAGNNEIITVKIDQGLKGIKVHFSKPVWDPTGDNTWHPDGKLVSFTIWSGEHKTRRIFSFNPQIKDSLKIMPGQNYEGDPENLCWTPDGKSIVFSLK